MYIYVRGVCIVGGQNDPAHGWFWFYEKWTKLQFRILQIMWTNAAVFDLKLEVIMSLCTFWSDWIIFPFHFWQNWSEMNKLGAKMFPHHHIKEKTTFFFNLAIANPGLTKHSRPHVNLSHTHAGAMVTAVNSLVLLAVLSRELTVTSENISLLKISFIWTEFGAEL